MGGIRDESFEQGEKDTHPVLSDSLSDTRPLHPYIPRDSQPFPIPPPQQSRRKRQGWSRRVMWTDCPLSSRSYNRPDISSRSRIPPIARTGMTATMTASRFIGGDAATAARALMCRVGTAAEMIRRLAVNKRIRYAPRGQGAKAGSSAGTRRVRSRRAGMAR
jgi:hypothetical protein